MHYILAYDIANEKRLYKVRKASYVLALGGQKSALETVLTKREIESYLQAMSKVIKHEEDAINIIEVEPEPILLGRAMSVDYDDGVIII